MTARYRTGFDGSIAVVTTPRKTNPDLRPEL
jgi:hypothetical protein